MPGLRIRGRHDSVSECIYIRDTQESRYTFKDLQRELKARGLRASGKKQELKDRLEVSLAEELANSAAQCVESVSLAASNSASQKNDKHATEEPSNLRAASAAAEQPKVRTDQPAPQIPVLPVSEISAGPDPPISSLQSSLRVPTFGEESAGNAENINCRLAKNSTSQFMEQTVHPGLELVKGRELKERVLADKKLHDAKDAACQAAAVQRREVAENRVGKMQEDDQASTTRRKSREVSNPATIPMSADSTTASSTHPVVMQQETASHGLSTYEKAQEHVSKPKSKPFSPIDTYEISDHEASTDDDEDNEERQQKHMPAWATGANLREALRAQANSDPSAVFAVGASSCDLKHIFKTDRAFKKRTSSQNWGMDLSTQIEKQKYRVEMGFTPLK